MNIEELEASKGSSNSQLIVATSSGPEVLAYQIFTSSNRSLSLASHTKSSSSLPRKMSGQVA